MSATNSVGQTAKDIAEFWLHDAVAAELSSHSLLSTTEEGTRCTQQSNYFCCSPLDRCTQLRTDTAWLHNASTAGNTVYILFVRLDLVVQKAGGASDQLLRPKRFTYCDIKSVLQLHKPIVIFLGVERASGSDLPPTDKFLTCAWFAINVDMSGEELCRLCPDAELVSVHPRVMKLARSEASVVGHARSILAWHDRYCFCPTCGAATEVKDGGYKRVCVKQDCRSKTGSHHFVAVVCNTNLRNLPSILGAVVG